MRLVPYHAQLAVNYRCGQTCGTPLGIKGEFLLGALVESVAAASVSAVAGGDRCKKRCDGGSGPSHQM